MMLDEFFRRYAALFGKVPTDVPETAWADAARQIPGDKADAIFDALTDKGSRYSSFKPKPYQIIPLIKGQAQAAKSDAYSPEYLEALAQSKTPLFSREGKRIRPAFSGELPSTIRQEIYKIMQAAGTGELHDQNMTDTIESMFDVQFSDYSPAEQAAIRRAGGRPNIIPDPRYTPAALEHDKAMRQRDAVQDAFDGTIIEERP